VKLLTAPKELEREFVGAMRRYQHYRWCVAWASSGFPLCEELLKRRDRLLQLVVGIHFYQTHPEFLEAVKDHKAARIIQIPSGVFHPKIYLFENNVNDWVCILGSPNFSGTAFALNTEAAVCFDSKSEKAEHNHRILRKFIDDRWREGQELTDQVVKIYRAHWEDSEPAREKLRLPWRKAVERIGFRRQDSVTSEPEPRMTKQMLKKILDEGQQVDGQEYAKHCKTHNVKTFYFFCKRLCQEPSNGALLSRVLKDYIKS
jgi:PLD-like domain